MDISFEGLLFDLDGTLVDSGEAVHRAWTAFAHKYQVDPNKFMSGIQGKPASEIVASLRPNASALEIKQDSEWLEKMEANDTEGVIALPGACELLNNLNSKKIPWAIVTSGTMPVATARIKAAELPQPKVLITPELVAKGKPAPDPYILAATTLGINIKKCVVFEDAPAGVKSGVQAGAKVVGMLTQFGASELMAVNATICISSLRKVSFLLKENVTTLTISQ